MCFILDVNQCITMTYSTLPPCGWMFRRCCFASGLVFFSFFGLQLACLPAPLRGVLLCSIRCGFQPEIVACCLNLSINGFLFLVD